MLNYKTSIKGDITYSDLVIKEIKPNKTILTNLNSELDYNNLLKFLPKNVIPAFDGLSFNI